MSGAEQAGTWNRLFSRTQSGKPEAMMNGGEDGSAPLSPHMLKKNTAGSSAAGVNLLPDIPPQGASRKLTAREQRDCEVIG